MAPLLAATIVSFVEPTAAALAGALALLIGLVTSFVALRASQPDSHWAHGWLASAVAAAGLIFWAYGLPLINIQ